MFGRAIFSARSFVCSAITVSSRHTLSRPEPGKRSPMRDDSAVSVSTIFWLARLRYEFMRAP